MINLKSKLTSETFGSWITIGHISVGEIMARSSFDWLTIDMEHSSITFEKAQELIAVISLSGVAPLVRVGVNDETIIKRVMDSGSYGVIVPMVNSACDAIKAVQSVKYPPKGRRGVGLGRAQGFGFNFEEYKKWVEEESIVIVQIEHIDAVNNLEEILSTDGVDGFIVGPYDLSASLGMPGEFDKPIVIDALKRVEEVGSKFNMARGFHIVHPTKEEILQKQKSGYNFIALGLDSLYLGNGCRNVLKMTK